MNKLIVIIFFSICLSTFIKCTSKDILLTNVNSNQSVITRLTLIDSSVYGFKFPNKIEIENNSFLNESFIRIDYVYGDSLTKWRNLGIELYKIDNNKLARISNNNKKTIPVKGSLNFIYFTRHFVDSSKATQEQFKPYVKKMLLENKDTLHIGTVTAFKKKHKELFEKLTKNDSISIRFLDNGSSRNRITVPVKW